MRRYRDGDAEATAARSLRRLLVGVAIFLLVCLFLVWRIENQRMERVRSAVMDVVLPAVEFGNKPVQYLSQVSNTLRNHFRVAERNSELEQEVDRLRFWRNEARRLELQNSRLRNLLNTQLVASEFSISATVLADINSQFQHTVLINAGTENGVANGWPVIGNGGLVGRVLSAGAKSSRILLLRDPSSRVPVKIIDSDVRGIVAGDGSFRPLLEFVIAGDAQPGDRVVTSGDGGVFPKDLEVGEIVVGSDQRMRLRLAADLLNLEFVSVLREIPLSEPTDVSDLIVGDAPPVESN
ncbi:MAG: rod shape-determining protein MreC [Rhodobacteraceae bacterium]|nr:rod shape-determining protein MreC [Paracoccaceae bacterium]